MEHRRGNMNDNLGKGSAISTDNFSGQPFSPQVKGQCGHLSLVPLIENVRHLIERLRPKPFHGGLDHLLGVSMPLHDKGWKERERVPTGRAEQPTDRNNPLSVESDQNALVGSVPP